MEPDPDQTDLAAEYATLLKDDPTFGEFFRENTSELVRQALSHESGDTPVVEDIVERLVDGLAAACHQRLEVVAEGDYHVGQQSSDAEAFDDAEHQEYTDTPATCEVTLDHGLGSTETIEDVVEVYADVPRTMTLTQADDTERKVALDGLSFRVVPEASAESGATAYTAAAPGSDYLYVPVTTGARLPAGIRRAFTTRQAAEQYLATRDGEADLFVEAIALGSEADVATTAWEGDD